MEQSQTPSDFLTNTTNEVSKKRTNKVLIISIVIISFLGIAIALFLLRPNIGQQVSEPIIGKWDGYGILYDDEFTPLFGQIASIEINSDGTFRMNLADSIASGKWEIWEEGLENFGSAESVYLLRTNDSLQQLPVIFDKETFTVETLIVGSADGLIVFERN